MDGNDETERAATIGVIAETMRSTVTVARALVDAGVRIDLSGLDRAASALCADAVALPQPLGRELIGPLSRLRDEISALELTLTDTLPAR
jgi:hypothetical protein